MTRSSFTNIIGLPHLDDIKWEQATSKIKFGGFGLTRISQVSHAAFLSSWCQSLKDLPNRFPSMAFLASYLESSALTSGSNGYTVWSSFFKLFHLCQNLSAQIRNLKLLKISFLTQNLCNIVYLPKLLLIVWMSLSQTCKRDAARLRSLQGKGAGAWLNVIPTSDKHAVKSNQFSLACYLRLGLAFPFINWIRTCDCGHDLDEQGFHLLTCKYANNLPSNSSRNLAAAYTDLSRGFYWRLYVYRLFDADIQNQVH